METEKKKYVSKKWLDFKIYYKNEGMVVNKC